MPGLSPRLQNPAPLGYATPPFPSLYWPYKAKPGVANYLYYTHDIWRYTLLWTLIIFAVFHLTVAGFAVLVQLGKGKSAWQYVWIIPLVYALIAGIEALLAGSIVGLISTQRDLIMPSLPSAATASPANPSSSSSATPRVELFDLMDSGELGQSSRFTDPRSSNIADVNQALDIYDKQYRSGQPKSLSGIAIRSLLLGISLASSTSLTIYLLASSSVLWRIPLFVASLALFHFLEFWTTAKYNTQSAEISSFLFSQNGSAYTIAHSAAIVECLLTNTLLSHPPWLPGPLNATLLSTGLILIAGGQITRSVAMIEAGTNFNHMVQYKKSRTHRLPREKVQQNCKGLPDQGERNPENAISNDSPVGSFHFLQWRRHCD
ncbi:hypothetical protein B7494_g761 [Chlorociboria aeruginascens]|nr:hypothetical protein B7494_g761 [Chlorociboria aeruginascens]